MDAGHLVLVVDDVLDNRSMYAEFLSIEGFRVLEADDGAEAVATARREAPDAIVLDVGLPTMDGIEATRLLRSDPTTKGMVVIAMSGHGIEVEARALAAGVDRYLRKPCHPHELVAILRALLEARAAP